MFSSATFQSATISAGQVIAADDLGYLALGIVFLALGLITLLLIILRTASRDDTVFLFGAMSYLWGLRFLLYTHFFGVLLGQDQSLDDDLTLIFVDVQE